METAPFAQAPIPEARPASLREVYLRRLRRLLRLRHQHEQELNRQGIRLLNHSVFAAYCDCRAIGVGEEARQILRQANVALRLNMVDAAPGFRAEASRRSA
ncbi:MAG: hypothetical protein A2148_00315 [Chloroflexi bacterium RBG_16_68_14]|nr:MAG: hypothetical protein A2148_00315 [Chloroflexi bacterium RBG_16_68_14]